MNLRNGTKEIKRREAAGGGGDSGGGGWFGWGGRFGWSNGDNFWPEAQQTSLAVLGIYCHEGISKVNTRVQSAVPTVPINAARDYYYKYGYCGFTTEGAMMNVLGAED
ncbi:hypothetical protein D5086_011911 [Populus alba]|uniref:Uncharacterized protein n=1 Tax=Populus alba TaxID=43335 RepID=A0ACC4C3I6_POPAL